LENSQEIVREGIVMSEAENRVVATNDDPILRSAHNDRGALRRTVGALRRTVGELNDRGKLRRIVEALREIGG
jgi:hypothetical protein